MDAIMGNDDKFINDIVWAAKELKPRFIALVRTPPRMTGTDFSELPASSKSRHKFSLFISRLVGCTAM